MFRWTPAALGLAGALALAGCATSGPHATPLDTGDIAPTSEATLVFAEAGRVELHCDPHPFMEHEVEVRDGAPATGHVHVLDGASASEYRFDPPAMVVAPGAAVTYHNHGALVHTASEMSEGMEH